MVVRALSKKLRRTIWNTKGQFLAMVAVVTAGVCVYIAVGTAFYNLSRSQENFYREYSFADYYFHVVRAPEQVIRQVKALPGVARATGRIQKDVPIYKEGSQRAVGRLVSYPLPQENEVNRLHVLSGRLFEAYPQSGGVEVLLDTQYFKANRLNFNDTVTIISEGRKVPLTVVGTATSPEFVYPMKDASSLIPEPETFGIIMLPHNQAQQVLNLSGQINQVVIQLVPGWDGEEVARRVENLLKPYGNLASYPRKQQLSHAALQGEMDGLRTFARVLPMIFLGVAAGVQFVMLGRMIRAQRLAIGVMKAIGYRSWQIMLHYASYAVAMSFAGALLGTVLGLLLASLISQMYAQYFHLPQAIGGLNLKAVVNGFLLSLGVGGAAGLTATRSVTTMRPAESMRPETPRGSSRTILERWVDFWRRLPPAW
ncbi:MAG: ABC transporter permease, partial [Syntrophomonadaceae bacterium]|nr:ABC transporter permease [Syntrophomonadaceae bacterium]